MIAVSLSLTVVYIPQYFRVVRNTTLSAKEATYIEAARAIGATRLQDHAQATCSATSCRACR